MKKTLYLLFALICAPLCMPTVAEAAVQPSQVQQAFPNYTKAELRYLISSTAKGLDIMADQTASYNVGSDAVVAITSAIRLIEAAYTMPTHTLSRDAQLYLADAAGVQRPTVVRLKQLLSMVEKGKLDNSAAIAKLQEIGAQAQKEMAKVDARHPQMAAKLNSEASTKFARVLFPLVEKDIEAEVAAYKTLHPGASKDELSIAIWRASARVLRNLANRL